MFVYFTLTAKLACILIFMFAFLLGTRSLTAFKFKFSDKEIQIEKKLFNFTTPTFIKEMSERFRNLTNVLPKVNFTVLFDVYE